jgi:hypothetical protein
MVSHRKLKEHLANFVLPNSPRFSRLANHLAHQRLCVAKIHRINLFEFSEYIAAPLKSFQVLAVDIVFPSETLSSKV